MGWMGGLGERGVGELDSFWSLFLIGMDLVEDLVCFGPTCKVNICHLPYLFFYDFAMLEDSGRGCGGTPKCSTVNVGHVWVCNT